MLAAALLALTGCSGGGSASSGFVAGKDGVDTVAAGHRSAAPALSGKTVDGATVSLADFAGKVVVVNVWGSWCPPCRAEAPGFEKVHARYAGQGVKFLGINTRDASVSQAKSFEKHFGITYPSLYDPYGKQILKFAKGTLNPQNIPSTVVVDQHGDVAARSLSPLSEDALAAMVEDVVSAGS